ncbi:MAG: arginine kinase [Rickettsiales bacterium]|nr:arginine kinase [Rickettsiales bacterium]
MFQNLKSTPKYLKHISLTLLSIALLSGVISNTVYAKALCIEGFEILSESERNVLKEKKTKFGVTLDHILKSGVENPDSKIGCYAGDAESYTMFSPIFSHAIKNYHNYDPYSLDNKNTKIVKFNFTKEDRKILSKNVISTRIRVARNLSSFPFPSSMTKKQRIQVKDLVLTAIKELPKKYQGTYYSIGSLSEDQYKKMVNEHLIFKPMNKDKYLQSAGIADNWPVGRGAYISKDKKFIVWINEEDHLRIIYLEKTADLEKIHSKFVHALNILEKDLKFAHDDKLGYLNSDSTNIGTGMRVSVHIKLKNIDIKTIKSIAKKYSLAVRGTHGEHSKALDGVYDISNARRLGITIDDIFTSLVNGTVSLVKKDRALNK